VQLEINPFVRTPTGRWVCIDAKFGFDDSAEYRQKAVFALRDTAEEDPREVAAGKVGINYVGLQGSIGCMVNGAGLAMATMDIIKAKGASPANFLDVGGGATKEQVIAAFQLLQSDPQVRGMLINIFGGIMRCDTIANGIVAAAKEVGIKFPLVVRLSGTNSAEGLAILSNSGLSQIQTAPDMDTAAEKIVALVNKA